MIKRHGKPLDVARLKQPVLNDVVAHVDAVARMAAYLAEHERPTAQRACYVCGGDRAHILTTIHGFEYVQCDACTHVFTTKRYAEDAIARFYQRDDYYARITYANRETCFYRREQVALPKVEFAEEFGGAGRGLWVDVGSGVGDVVSVATERGWSAVGLEISETSVAFARDVFGVELEPETFQSFARRRRDLAGQVAMVSFLGVLEHGVDPLGELRLAHGMLSAGGSVLVQVPNAGSVSSMIQSVFPDHVFRHMSPVSHIMLFTERSLMAAFERTGFEPVALWHLGLDVYELVTALTAMSSRMQESPLQRLLIDRFNELQAVFDRHEVSDGLICVARKKAVV